MHKDKKKGKNKRRNTVIGKGVKSPGLKKSPGQQKFPKNKNKMNNKPKYKRSATTNLKKTPKKYKSKDKDKIIKEFKE